MSQPSVYIIHSWALNIPAFLSFVLSFSLSLFLSLSLALTLSILFFVFVFVSVSLSLSLSLDIFSLFIFLFLSLSLSLFLSFSLSLACYFSPLSFFLSLLALSTFFPAAATAILTRPMQSVKTYSKYKKHHCT
jgi:hypothetical protein